MTQLIISDLHLDPSRPAVTRAFYEFLQDRAREAETLYILGDFFEAWVGDDDDAPLSLEIQDKLRQYVDAGHKLFFMHGNRDFLVGEGFARNTGATLLEDPTVVSLGGENVLLMHGDSLCTGDTEYMAFRQQARNPAWQQSLLSRPLEERRAIAAQLRATSKSMNSLKAEDIMDVTQSEVERLMLENGVQTLIHGHTHRPAVHEFSLDNGPARRIVLGDWHDLGWCIRADNNRLDLINWPIAD